MDGTLRLLRRRRRRSSDTDFEEVDGEIDAVVCNGEGVLTATKTVCAEEDGVLARVQGGRVTDSLRIAIEGV